jgi:hypothetical protein
VLWRRLWAEWDGLAAAGCDPVLLRERAIITPVCGLVGFEPRQAVQVSALASNLAQRLESVVDSTTSRRHV